MKAQAAKLARRAVRGGLFQALPDGAGLARVTDPAALAALEGAFCRMLRDGGSRRAKLLTPEAARGSPSHCHRPAWGQRCWLLVAPDCGGRLGFRTQWAAGDALPEMEAAFLLADPTFTAWRNTTGFGADFAAGGHA
jgi:hypothetical protein